MTLQMIVQPRLEPLKHGMADEKRGKRHQREFDQQYARGRFPIEENRTQTQYERGYRDPGKAHRAAPDILNARSVMSATSSSDSNIANVSSMPAGGRTSAAHSENLSWRSSRVNGRSGPPRPCRFPLPRPPASRSLRHRGPAPPRDDSAPRQGSGNRPPQELPGFRPPPPAGTRLPATSPSP